MTISDFGNLQSQALAKEYKYPDFDRKHIYTSEDILHEWSERKAKLKMFPLHKLLYLKEAYNVGEVTPWVPYGQFKSDGNHRSGLIFTTITQPLYSTAY